MNFLIFGCNGMIGHTVALYLKEQGHEVLGFDLQKSIVVDSVVGDVRDTNLVHELVKSGRYDSVVNCTGLLNQHADQNKSLAAYMNGFFPHYLAEITSDTDVQVIQMSTDCVFSGKKGRYTEDDLKEGESFYARSKGLGELEDGKNLTLRNSNIGPELNPDGIGLMNWFMRQNDTANGFTKAIWTGLTTLQLAKTIELGAREKAFGLYHAVPSESINKYELLCLMNKYLRNNELEIVPIEGVNLDKSLIRTRHQFDFTIPGYEQMVCELAEWVSKHKELYPHYNFGGLNNE